MEDKETILSVATGLNLVDTHGELKDVDSLAMMSFVMRLEKAFGLRIPTANLRKETFESIDTVANLIVSLRR